MQRMCFQSFFHPECTGPPPISIWPPPTPLCGPMWPIIPIACPIRSTAPPAAPANGGTRIARRPLVLIPDASGCLKSLPLLPSGPRGVLYGPTTQAVTVHNDLGVGPPRFSWSSGRAACSLSPASLNGSSPTGPGPWRTPLRSYM